MWFDFFRAVRAIWALQRAFDSHARGRREAALRELEQPSFKAFSRWPLADTAIQHRILLLVLRLEAGKRVVVGRLLADIRASRSFNQDERALLLKYVLTCLWFYGRPQRLSWLKVAQGLKFNPDLVHPTLRGRYCGCVGLLAGQTTMEPS